MFPGMRRATVVTPTAGGHTLMITAAAMATNLLPPVMPTVTAAAMLPEMQRAAIVIPTVEAHAPTAMTTAAAMTTATDTLPRITFTATSAPCLAKPISIPACGRGRSTSSRGSRRRNRQCTACPSRR